MTKQSDKASADKKAITFIYAERINNVLGDGSTVNQQTKKENRAFLVSGVFLACMSWGLGALANMKAETDVIQSLGFAIPALIIWSLAILMMIFAHFEKKKGAVT